MNLNMGRLISGRMKWVTVGFAVLALSTGIVTWNISRAIKYVNEVEGMDLGVQSVDDISRSPEADRHEKAMLKVLETVPELERSNEIVVSLPLRELVSGEDIRGIGDMDEEIAAIVEKSREFAGVLRDNIDISVAGLSDLASIEGVIPRKFFSFNSLRTAAMISQVLGVMEAKSGNFDAAADYVLYLQVLAHYSASGFEGRPWVIGNMISVAVEKIAVALAFHLSRNPEFPDAVAISLGERMRIMLEARYPLTRSMEGEKEMFRYVSRKMKSEVRLGTWFLELYYGDMMEEYAHLANRSISALRYHAPLAELVYREIEEGAEKASPLTALALPIMRRADNNFRCTGSRLQLLALSFLLRQYDTPPETLGNYKDLSIDPVTLKEYVYHPEHRMLVGAWVASMAVKNVDSYIALF